MKVLILSNLYPNKQFPNNGIFVYEQVENLSVLKVDITVFSPIPYVFPFFNFVKNKWAKYREIKNIEILNGKKIFHPKYIAIPGGYLKQYWYLILTYNMKRVLLNELKEHNFDLIHVQGSAPDDYTGYKLSQFLKIPYILTIHGDTVLALSKNRSRFSKSKQAIIKANAVIAVSQKVKKRIIELTNREENVFVVNNGYTQIESKVDFERKDEKINILFVGNLIAQKGCLQLLEAFYELSVKYDNIYLQIVGAGPQRKDITQYISNKKNLSRKIQLFGAIPHKKVLELMQKCDIFILPSINEAFGVVYLEAMSFKKPVIGSRGEGICDIIQNGFNGLLIDPKIVIEIFEALEFLILNEDKRKTLGINGYNSIKELTWNNNAKNIIKIYQRVLEERNIR